MNLGRYLGNAAKDLLYASDAGLIKILHPELQNYRNQPAGYVKIPAIGGDDGRRSARTLYLQNLRKTKPKDRKEVERRKTIGRGMHRNLNQHFNNGNAPHRPFAAPIRTRLTDRLVEKWLNTIVGIVCFLFAVFVILQNEARAVHTTKLLEESIALVTSVVPEAEVNRSNIGNLVYLTGKVSIHEPLTEVDYGISVLAVKLFRNVQMYQWVEAERDILDGDGYTIATSYDYYTDWQNNLIDSSHFSSSMGHWNPKEFPIKKETQINENVKVGKYNLGLALKKKFTDFVHVTGDERPERQDIKLHAGLYYHCQNIWKPEVGDVRVQFSYAGQHGQVVTIVAKLDETLTLVPFPHQGMETLMLKLGQFPLETMFSAMHSLNKFLTWLYRGGGWALLYGSFTCLSPYLQIIVHSSPTLQEILPVTHSSLRMTVSMCFSLMLTAFAWVWYRALLGLSLILATVFVLCVNKWISRGLPSHQYNRL